MNLACKYCGKPFSDDDKRTYFCSPVCKSLARKNAEPKIQKNCATCHKPFMTNNKSVCCGDPCLEIHNRQKRTEYEQKTRVINDKSQRLVAALDRVVLHAWQKGDDDERAIIEFHNPKMRFEL